MSEDNTITKASEAEVKSSTSVQWADFLAAHPPNKERIVSGMGRHMEPLGPNFVLATPNLSLHCRSCGGNRTFRCEGGHDGQLYYNNWNKRFLTYVCGNCPGERKTSKTYALACCWKFTSKPKRPARLAGRPIVESVVPNVKQEDLQEALKLGEWPPFGPISPRELLKLVDADRAFFEAGRRAEAEGMGIGAFAYYRRVVENQRKALFDEIISAAERLKVSAEIIDALKQDRDKWQFSQSLKGLKAVMPERLKVHGHSPLALLHQALSHNLHSESDETCLEAAKDIRIVLTDLAEQLDSVLKDQIEVEKTVGRLTRKL
jgi:hypothetical protein